MLLGAGCAAQTKPTAAGPGPTPNAVQPATPTSLANPAAVKCKNDGLGYRMGENAAGQYGVCIFDDKSECDEWAYFRGECKKGDCKSWESCALNTQK